MKEKRFSLTAIRCYIGELFNLVVKISCSIMIIIPWYITGNTHGSYFNGPISITLKYVHPTIEIVDRYMIKSYALVRMIQVSRRRDYTHQQFRTTYTYNVRMELDPTNA